MRKVVIPVIATLVIGSAAAQRDPVLRLAVNMTTIESAPLFLAAEGPAGARLRVSSGGIVQLVSHEADAATNSSTQAVLRSVASPNIRIVLTVAECYYRIVAKRSAGIARLADLRGKRIGTPLNTSAHFFLAKMLGTVKLAESDVTVVPLAQSAMAAGLKNGDVEAVSIWEPWAQYAIEAIGKDAVVLQDRSVYRELFNLNTTADALADPPTRAAVVDLVRATVDASTRVRRGSAAVGPLLASKIDVREETTAAVWQEFRFPASLPHDLLDVLVEEEAWLAGAQQRPPRSRSVLASLIEPSVLADALRSRR